MAIKAMALLSIGCLSVPAQPQKEGGLSGRRDSLKPIVVQGCPPTFVSAPGRRIVAVGDLHGDIAQARSALEMAGVLDPADNNLWIGGETVLVQLGDILDRGEDEIAILSLLRSLSIQAKQEGGAIFQINGNHESMNIEGDFRYVTPEGFDECIDFLEYLDGCDTNWENAFIGWARESEIWKEKRKMSTSHWSAFNLMKRQKGISARSFLLKPGGPLACELACHPVVLKIDDWVFCHGGLLPHHVVYGIERMNKEVSHWMSGTAHEDSEIPFVAIRGYDSVVWNRLYSRDSEEIGYSSQQISVIVQETLHEIGAKTIVVGHTPQLSGANCKYNDSVWRIDVGMSSGVLNKAPEVLEIVDNQPRVIKNKSMGPSDIQGYLKGNTSIICGNRQKHNIHIYRDRVSSACLPDNLVWKMVVTTARMSHKLPSTSASATVTWICGILDSATLKGSDLLTFTWKADLEKRCLRSTAPDIKCKRNHAPVHKCQKVCAF